MQRKGAEMVQSDGEVLLFPADLDEVFLSFSSTTGHGAFLGALGR
jgi:hypothetical protein